MGKRVPKQTCSAWVHNGCLKCLRGLRCKRFYSSENKVQPPQEHTKKKKKRCHTVWWVSSGACVLAWCMYACVVLASVIPRRRSCCVCALRCTRCVRVAHEENTASKPTTKRTSSGFPSKRSTHESVRRCCGNENRYHRATSVNGRGTKAHCARS